MNEVVFINEGDLEEQNIFFKIFTSVLSLQDDIFMGFSRRMALRRFTFRLALAGVPLNATVHSVQPQGGDARVMLHRKKSDWST